MSTSGRYGRHEILCRLLLTIFKHEWAAHGTCYSTLKPNCLPRGSPRGTEAALFFQRVVELFKQLPTYQWLAQQGITPSQTRTHTLDEVLDALKASSGVRCMLSCSAIVLITKLICPHSLPQPSRVLAKRSLRSVGISLSEAHSSTASSSPLVRRTVHTA
jgi:hypothetical protein